MHFDIKPRYNKIVAYSNIRDYIEKDRTWEGLYSSEEILDHKEMKPSDPDYKGCRYNVLVKWSTGERTLEPLHTKNKAGVWDTDPVTVAIYTSEHNLLNTPGWRLGNIQALAKMQKRMIRVANQAKLKSWQEKPMCMYGFLIPQAELCTSGTN